MLRRLVPAVCLLAALGGCDLLGLESATQIAARREGEGKAIGAACRHAARAIEDCYTLNRKADKAAVFAGWREMDDYMRENKLEPVRPELPRPGAPAASADATAEAPAEEEHGAGGKAAKPH